MENIFIKKYFHLKQKVENKIINLKNKIRKEGEIKNGYKEKSYQEESCEKSC